MLPARLPERGQVWAHPVLPLASMLTASSSASWFAFVSAFLSILKMCLVVFVTGCVIPTETTLGPALAVATGRSGTIVFAPSSRPGHQRLASTLNLKNPGYSNMVGPQNMACGKGLVDAQQMFTSRTGALWYSGFWPGNHFWAARRGGRWLCSRWQPVGGKLRSSQAFPPQHRSHAHRWRVAVCSSCRWSMRWRLGTCNYFDLKTPRACHRWSHWWICLHFDGAAATNPGFDFVTGEHSSGPSKSWERHFSNNFFGITAPSAEYSLHFHFLHNPLSSRCLFLLPFDLRSESRWRAMLGIMSRLLAFLAHI